jgi:CubicO group peptidase (beta-lactamase class C family)
MTNFRFTPSLAREAGFAPDVLGELINYVDVKIANGDLPGAVMLLARGDNLVFSSVSGYADLASKTPLHSDAIFTLYSMSKPLTAVGILTLYDEGRWKLDDPVSRFLPEFKDIAALPGSAATREPTMLELFTHTAGFSFGRTPEEVMETIQRVDWSGARSLSELIGRYASMPLAYQPGEDWQYSVATDLQAEIVERLTGERFDLYMSRRVFEPLGMTDTRFRLDHDQARRLVRGYVQDADSGSLRPATEDEKLESIFPMGGTSFVSTAMDFARFARMLLNGGVLGDARILSSQAVELMLSNHLSDNFLETTRGVQHYVLGNGNGHALNGLVCVDPVRAGRPVGKGTYEWGGAFGTWFWADPENDIIFVGMTHVRRGQGNMRPLDVISQELVYRAFDDRRS